ncbi:MAG: Two-component response regulator CreB [Pseudomonadota bacterium]
MIDRRDYRPVIVFVQPWVPLRATADRLKSRKMPGNGYNRGLQSAPCILLVDDEPAIAEAVGFALQAEGFRTRHCVTGTECLAALDEESPALILLDVGLPDGSGFGLFGRIRERSLAPVMFLTARKEEIDRVVGLEMGADDYIVKPFSLRELVARVRRVVRRGQQQQPLLQPVVDVQPAVRVLGAFAHDAARRRFSFHGKPLDLTLHEYRLLEALLQHPGRVYTRGQLLELAWEAPDHRLDRTVDSHVKSLRAKLRDVDGSVDPIQTHRGMGYSLDVDA